MTLNDLKKLFDDNFVYWVDYYPEATSPELKTIEELEKYLYETGDAQIYIRSTVPAWMGFCDVAKIYTDPESDLPVIMVKENQATRVIRETIEEFKTGGDD